MNSNRRLIGGSVFCRMEPRTVAALTLTQSDCAFVGVNRVKAPFVPDVRFGDQADFGAKLRHSRSHFEKLSKWIMRQL
jgi:hypothetical protein